MDDASTHPVSEAVFRQVYDSPASLPGEYQWVTPDEDVRRIETILNMPEHTIGAPLWVSGDSETCRQCDRRISWLDIVASALREVHSREMVARVIIGDQKYVNVEAPRAIKGVRCVDCDTPFETLRSFKCHNWAYASEAMAAVLEQMARSG